MKHNLYKTGLIGFFVIMLLMPEVIFTGSKEGLLLWFQIVLPTLFPFMIVSNLLIYSKAVVLINRLLSPLLCRFFNISRESCFAVVAGFLCGYPMGAKVTADLIRTGHITHSEGNYILSFCNNTSPFFVLNFVLLQNLRLPEQVLPLFAILMLSPILASFLFRPFYPREKRILSQQKEKKIQAHDMKFGFSIIDTCIMDSFETITKVGGYIILFSIAVTCIQSLPFGSASWLIPLLSSLEITNGILILCEAPVRFPLRLISVLMLTSFGGWCAIMQTYSMIQPANLSLKPYILQKLITACVTGLLTILFLIVL